VIELKGEFVGLTQAITGLQKLERGQPEAVARGAYGWYEEVMTQSKKECPVDTGALKSTGHVEKPVISGSVVTIVGGYGGPAGSGTHVGIHSGRKPPEQVGYAEHVHENLAANHPSGKAKFLEDPINEAWPKLDGDIAGEIDIEVQKTFPR
jgi:hypothetical protein